MYIQKLRDKSRSNTVLSRLYRHSQRMVHSAMQDILGISMSLGTVNKLRLEASNAVVGVLLLQSGGEVPTHTTIESIPILKKY